VAQVVEHLPSKSEALSSNSVLQKKKKKEKKKKIHTCQLKSAKIILFWIAFEIFHTTLWNYQSHAGYWENIILGFTLFLTLEFWIWGKEKIFDLTKW
jgi:K+ transporter